MSRRRTQLPFLGPICSYSLASTGIGQITQPHTINFLLENLNPQGRNTNLSTGSCHRYHRATCTAYHIFEDCLHVALYYVVRQVAHKGRKRGLI